VWLQTRLAVVGPADAGDVFVGEPPAPGTYVALEVRDGGCGMDDATRARIFDPFFTTKGFGRGLGLAAIRGIVRSHGGGMRLETAEGRGSRFEVLLPVSERPVATRTAQSPPLDGEAPGVHGTVLVVDDEDGVRFAASMALEYGGFRVLTAANGAEAVSLFGTHGGEIVAVVLDKSMPVMGGEEALRALRQRRHDLPIVLTSGFTGSLPRAGSYEGPLPHVLPKPYRSEALVDAVNAAIRGETPALA
jgi:CheY-like chemotaxis protein